jgi:hypothetical protein
MRAVGIFLVATTIGATAGGGVLFSLVDVSTSEASVGAHTSAAPVQALISAPEAAQPNPKPIVEPAMDSGGNGGSAAAASESSTSPKVVVPADIAPLSEVGPDDGSVKVATPPPTAVAPTANKTTNNRRVTRHAEPRVARGGYGALGWGGSASHFY